MVEIYEPAAEVGPRFWRDTEGPQSVSPNERAILLEIWRDPGVTRAALAGRLNITQQSIHRILSELNGRGLVLIGPLAPTSQKGKPSPRLLLNPRYACSVGISVNSGSTDVAIMDFAGNHITSHIHTRDVEPMAEVLDKIDMEIETLLGRSNFARKDLFGSGFSISGFLVDGTRYNPPEPMAEWAEYQLGPYVSQRLGMPVWTENVANAAALCELMFGIGRDVRNFVYTSFNYGLGAGIVVDGTLLRGGFGNAGELSGMFTQEEMPRRPVLSSLIEILSRNGHVVSVADQLSDAFDMNWTGVEAWLEMITPHFNRVYNVLSATVDPEVIVLGGEIPSVLAAELVRRTKSYQEPRHGILRKMPRLEQARIRGGASSAIGAATLPLKEGFF